MEPVSILAVIGAFNLGLTIYLHCLQVQKQRRLIKLAQWRGLLGDPKTSR